MLNIWTSTESLLNPDITQYVLKHLWVKAGGEVSDLNSKIELHLKNAHTELCLSPYPGITAPG